MTMATSWVGVACAFPILKRMGRGVVRSGNIQHPTTTLPCHTKHGARRVVTFWEENTFSYPVVTNSVERRQGNFTYRVKIPTLGSLHSKRIVSMPGRRLGMPPTFLTFWAALSHRQHHPSIPVRPTENNNKGLASPPTRDRAKLKTRMSLATGPVRPPFIG